MCFYYGEDLAILPYERILLFCVLWDIKRHTHIRSLEPTDSTIKQARWVKKELDTQIGGSI